MDPNHMAEVLKHLEKQIEMLTRVQRMMADEMHKLQVEEEMLMRKLHAILTKPGIMKKNGDKKDETAEGRQVD